MLRGRAHSREQSEVPDDLSCLWCLVPTALGTPGSDDRQEWTIIEANNVPKIQTHFLVQNLAFSDVE